VGDAVAVAGVGSVGVGTGSGSGSGSSSDDGAGDGAGVVAVGDEGGTVGLVGTGSLLPPQSRGAQIVGYALVILSQSAWHQLLSMRVCTEMQHSEEIGSPMRGEAVGAEVMTGGGGTGAGSEDPLSPTMAMSAQFQNVSEESQARPPGQLFAVVHFHCNTQCSHSVSLGSCILMECTPLEVPRSIGTCAHVPAMPSEGIHGSETKPSRAGENETTGSGSNSPHLFPSGSALPPTSCKRNSNLPP